MLSDGEAEFAGRSIGQSKREATSVVADGFFLDEWQRGEFDGIECWFGFGIFEVEEGEEEGG